MPDLGPDKTMAVSYPPEELYEQWSQRAEEMNLPVSQFIIRMVEAGRKQLNLENVANDSLKELRRQRSDLQTELERERQRVQELERQLFRTAQTDIIDYIEDNPGSTTPEIIQHMADTVPSRVTSHLDALEGDLIVYREDKFYPKGTTSEPLTQKPLEEATEQ